MCAWLRLPPAVRSPLSGPSPSAEPGSGARVRSPGPEPGSRLDLCVQLCRSPHPSSLPPLHRIQILARHLRWSPDSGYLLRRDLKSGPWERTIGAEPDPLSFFSAEKGPEEGSGKQHAHTLLTESLLKQATIWVIGALIAYQAENGGWLVLFEGL